MYSGKYFYVKNQEFFPFCTHVPTQRNGVTKWKARPRLTTPKKGGGGILSFYLTLHADSKGCIMISKLNVILLYTFEIIQLF